MKQSTAILIFLLILLISCYGCFSVPDLSNCNRVEINYYPSALVHHIGLLYPRNILTEEEVNFVKSFDQYTVTDKQIIKDFANVVKEGKFNGIVWGKVSYATPVYFDCYQDNKHIITFGIFGNNIFTKDRRIFKYPVDMLTKSLKKVEPTELKPLILRSTCTFNLGCLYSVGSLLRLRAISYPNPNKWCDVILRDRNNTGYVNEEEMLECFRCPSSGEGECHYAMNPNCTPDSPDDMVLLFETEAGWNQHGGPELFTFDNHDPKGGCVLLNDGTVKFIRTEEELNQLRWK